MKRDHMRFVCHDKPWGVDVIVHTPGVQHGQRLTMTPIQWASFVRVMEAGLEALPEEREKMSITVEVEV